MGGCAAGPAGKGGETCRIIDNRLHVSRPASTLSWLGLILFLWLAVQTLSRPNTALCQALTSPKLQATDAARTVLQDTLCSCATAGLRAVTQTKGPIIAVY